MQTFEKIGFDKIDEIVDKGYIKAPWLLYGSKKQENMDSYKVTSCFNSDGRCILNSSTGTLILLCCAGICDNIIYEILASLVECQVISII